MVHSTLKHSAGRRNTWHCNENSAQILKVENTSPLTEDFRKTDRTAVTPMIFFAVLLDSLMNSRSTHTKHRNRKRFANAHPSSSEAQAFIHTSV
jgi:hypothetical protein